MRSASAQSLLPRAVVALRDAARAISSSSSGSSSCELEPEAHRELAAPLRRARSVVDASAVVERGVRVAHAARR